MKDGMDILADEIKKSKDTSPLQMGTPWKCKTELMSRNYRVRDRSTSVVANCKYKEHAAYIVRAVNEYADTQRLRNSHEELVNTLHHLLNQPELLTDDFYRKQIKEKLAKAEQNESIY